MTSFYYSLKTLKTYKFTMLYSNKSHIKHTKCSKYHNNRNNEAKVYLAREKAPEWPTQHIYLKVYHYVISKATLWGGV